MLSDVIIFNDQNQVNSKDGRVIKQVEEFQYLGTWLNANRKNIEIRFAKAWSVHKKMSLKHGSQILINLLRPISLKQL